MNFLSLMLLDFALDVLLIELSYLIYLTDVILDSGILWFYDPFLIYPLPNSRGGNLLGTF